MRETESLHKIRDIQICEHVSETFSVCAARACVYVFVCLSDRILEVDDIEQNARNSAFSYSGIITHI